MRPGLFALAAAALVGAVGLAAPGRASAQVAGDVTPDLGCAASIRLAELGLRLPPGLLGAIAMVESGRADPRTGRLGPWPWTINIAGTGHFYESKAEAIAAVEAARAQGIQSIDVGCMQINLMYHPLAFANLDLAFDPQANAAYAADFLTRLFGQLRSWPEAAASYHSATPGLREDYQRRVMLGWQDAARYGYTGAAAIPRPAIASAIAATLRYSPALRAQLATAAGDHARWVAMGIVPAPAAQAGHAARPRTRIVMAGLRTND